MLQQANDSTGAETEQEQKPSQCYARHRGNHDIKGEAVMQ